MAIDLLAPLGDNNRDENLLIDFGGFIKNLTEMVLLAIFDNEETLQPLIGNKDFYNALKEEYSKNKVQCFYEIAPVLPEYFISLLNPEGYESVDDLLQSLDLVRDINVLEKSSNTIFEFALHSILQKSFCKSVTFYLPQKYEFKSHEIEYIYNTFNEYADKISIVEGSYEEAAEKNDYTTICTNDVEFIMRALKSWNEDKLKNTLFILCNNNTNLSMDNEMSYAYTQEIESLTKGKDRAVTRMWCLSLDDNTVDTIDFTGKIVSPPSEDDMEEGNVFILNELEDNIDGV